MNEIDPKQNEKISGITAALEEVTRTLLNKQPFDNSKVIAAINQFGTRQEQANALCSAVMQGNQMHKASGLNVPSILINGEMSGKNWAALRVYSEFQGDDKTVLQETIFTLPLESQDQLKVPNLKCDLMTSQKQADAGHTQDGPAKTSGVADPSQDPHKHTP